MELFAEQNALQKLWAKLDESLLSHARDLSAESSIKIVDVYDLQGLAELHCYLCWEENSHEYSFPICDLLQETGAKESLPLAEPEPPKKLSVREQLRTAMKEARQQSTSAERPRGDEGR